jgi:hypothetical protein
MLEAIIVTRHDSKAMQAKPNRMIRKSFRPTTAKCYRGIRHLRWGLSIHPRRAVGSASSSELRQGSGSSGVCQSREPDAILLPSQPRLA